MRMAGGVCLVYCALVLQTALVPHWPWPGAALRFIPLAVYLLATWLPTRSGLWVAALCGLAADCLTSGPLGVDTAGCVLQFWLLTRGGRTDRLWTPASLITRLPLAVGCQTLWGLTGRLWLDRGLVNPLPLAPLATASALTTTLFLLSLVVVVRGLFLPPRRPSAV